jgi:hypothetical protein
MKHRIFIVAPNYDGDTLHVVCKTKDKDRLLDIYQTDRYVEIGETDNLHDAKQLAWLNGAGKRPTVI